MTAAAERLLWIDASAGVAGDMLLGALLDAGASHPAVSGAIEAVVPGEVEVRASEVTRAGLRARYVEVVSRVEDHPHRSWRDIRALLARAALEAPVRDRALAVFGRLAEAEGRVHGIPVEDVHFHEVGAWDSIADVVGVCAALHSLRAGRVVSGPVALGSGHVQSGHGRLPVPAPAVLELARGRDVLAGGSGELATPTGMAILAALAPGSGSMPAMRVDAIGVGAGTRDADSRANVVRAVLGMQAGKDGQPAMVVLETNVDDLDPRIWPGVLSALLDAGAADAWITPILMKKGRPAHTLSVLAHGARRAALREMIFDLTTTLGVRETEVVRTALDREWRTVDLDGEPVRIKLGLRCGRIVQATPEYADAEALARTRAVPVRQVLQEAASAARAAGIYPVAACHRDGATA